MISGCESLEGKTLTIDYEDIGNRAIPFSSCIIKDGRIYYLTQMSQVLDNMGFIGVREVTSNTVICTGYDNCNRNIKSVGLVAYGEKVFIKITLNSEFPLYENYESLTSGGVY